MSQAIQDYIASLGEVISAARLPYIVLDLTNTPHAKEVGELEVWQVTVRTLLGSFVASVEITEYEDKDDPDEPIWHNVVLHSGKGTMSVRALSAGIRDELNSVLR